MRSIAPMRTAKIGYIVMSAVLCALGGLLIVMPGLSAAVIGTVCGVMLIVFGMIKLVGYFSKDLYRLAFQYDFAFGTLMVVLGVLMLCHPESLLNFICIALGISVMADGLFKVQIAVDSRKFGIKDWWVILMLAVLATVLGIILLCRPGAGTALLMTVLGLSLLAEGLLNLGTALAAVKIVKHQQPDNVEIFETEKKE